MKTLPDAACQRAAASLYRYLTSDPPPTAADGFLSTHPAWKEIADDVQRKAAARARVHELVAGAADVAEWAVGLGDAGLTPFESHTWGTAAGVDFAVQIAASPDLLPAHRRELIRAVHTAVQNTYERFLGQVPDPRP